ncbi:MULTISPECIES: helix-turn-helix transcriptional regulator [unclassified Pseudomonas]|uniref:helix-turn-helix transcriptional regulator n=1 Tax=unclassified Pseudomonas TaxID=196821 RepID=UPI00245695E3|nr:MULTISPECIES: helix-turn-helix transcriptional regulator [unclassified Pseudomonas]
MRSSHLESRQKSGPVVRILDLFPNSSQRATPGGPIINRGRQPTPANPFAFNGFLDLVSAIGTSRMPEKLLTVLQDVCGADHCAVFEQRADHLIQHDSAGFDGGNRILEMGITYVEEQYWRGDPVYQQLLHSPQAQAAVVSRINTEALEDQKLRTLYSQINAERFVISGLQSGSVYGLHVLRERRRESISDLEICSLSGIGSSLISILAKHIEVLGQRQRIGRVWQLSEIELLINQQPSDLSLRERSVCARIIYGMSSAGIALDLGIGEESVKTYRKRAYQRLGIGSSYELGKWFTTLQGIAMVE